jgi:hypothetical protein
MHRRQFLQSSRSLFLGAGFGLAVPWEQAAGRRPELTDQLSPEEMALVGKSVMAKDLDNYFGKGFSCAESGLAVALRFLKKPDELVWVAGAFGGGLNNRDLCGFLTAGEMAIGLYAGDLKLEKSAARAVCSQKAREFWQWWIATAPLHCAEIREGRSDLRVCARLGKLAAAKLEDLMKPAG